MPSKDYRKLKQLSETISRVDDSLKEDFFNAYMKFEGFLNTLKEEAIKNKNRDQRYLASGILDEQDNINVHDYSKIDELIELVEYCAEQLGIELPAETLGKYQTESIVQTPEQPTADSTHTGSSPFLPDDDYDAEKHAEAKKKFDEVKNASEAWAIDEMTAQDLESKEDASEDYLKSAGSHLSDSDIDLNEFYNAKIYDESGKLTVKQKRGNILDNNPYLVELFLMRMPKMAPARKYLYQFAEAGKVLSAEELGENVQESLHKALADGYEMMIDLKDSITYETEKDVSNIVTTVRSILMAFETEPTVDQVLEKMNYNSRGTVEQAIRDYKRIKGGENDS